MNNDIQEQINAFDRMTEAMKNTPIGKQIMDEIAKNPPVFTVRDISADGTVAKTYSIPYSVTDKNNKP